MKTTRIATMFGFLAALVANARAEVMDKEPALSSVVTIGFVAILACFLAARFAPKALWGLVPVSLFLWLRPWSEINDRFVGSAIRQEAGLTYIWSVNLMPAVLVAAILASLYWRKQALTAQSSSSKA